MKKNSFSWLGLFTPPSHGLGKSRALLALAWTVGWLGAGSAAAAPVITTQPTNTIGYVGYTTRFSVASTGAAPIKYQWLTNGLNIALATNNSYTTPVLVLGDNGKVFSAVVSNASGSVSSSNATLTVSAPSAPAIVTPPANTTVALGATAKFTVQASGAPLFYQWRTNGINISGATSTNYTTAATVFANNGLLYSVIVSNSVGAVTSTPALLSVIPAALKITFRPLTLGEITRYGLTNTTQIAAGGANVGLGQPAYLDALMTKGASAFYTNVTWTLSHWANGSHGTNTLKASPLTTNVPCADYGDTLAYDIAGRAMLVPDAIGTNNNGDYVVVVSFAWTNGLTVSATNTVYGSLYRGKDTCYLCHPSKMNDFEHTLHASTFMRDINGAVSNTFKTSCVACHTLGYDTTPAANNGGFDDVAKSSNWKFPSNLANPAAAANNWKNMPAAVKRLANVQCESCHGPGARHILSSGNTNQITISLSADNCGQCHDYIPAPAGQTARSKNYEWAQTWHALGKPGGGHGVFGTGGCAACHATKTFLDTNFPGVDEHGSNVLARGTSNEGITCVACHDPHSPGMGDAQLRSVPSYTLQNGYVTTNGGNGQICYVCHHDRSSANAVITTNAALPSLTTGPHYSAQTDMLFGQNGVEFGITMPSPAPHANIEDTCVGCHMQDVPANFDTNAIHHVGGHTYSLSWILTTNAITMPAPAGTNWFLTERCKSCHGAVSNFAFGGVVWTNRLIGCQEEVSNLLFQVSKLLDSTNDGAHIATSAIRTNKDASGYAQKAAYFNWNFVKFDGSLGVHNPQYAKSLLRASIAAIGGVSPGPYGNYPVPAGIAAPLTADGSTGSGVGGTGSGSASSGTGVKPSAMMVGGTSGTGTSGAWLTPPLQLNLNPAVVSTPTSEDQLQLLPAIELAYRPTNHVAGVKFQAVTMLGDTWVDLDTPVVVTNGCNYQLISYRDATQRFFRATAP